MQRLLPEHAHVTVNETVLLMMTACWLELVDALVKEEEEPSRRQKFMVWSAAWVNDVGSPEAKCGNGCHWGLLACLQPW